MLHKLAIPGIRRNLPIAIALLLLVSLLALGWSMRDRGNASTERGPTGSSGENLEALKQSTRIEKVSIIDAIRVGARIVAVGERGSAFYSENDGDKWQAAIVPTEKALTGLTVCQDGKILATGHGGVIAYSNDKGSHWALAEVPKTQKDALFGIHMLDGQRGLAYGAYASLLMTEDSGMHWTKLDPFPQDVDKHIYGLEKSKNDLVLVGEAGFIATSADSGKSWSVAKSPYAGSFFGITALENGGLIAYGMRGNVFHSNDQGNSWNQVKSDTNSPFYSATTLADKSILLTGKDGVLSRVDLASRSLTTTYVADHRSVSRAIESEKSGLLLFGIGGVRRAK